MEKVCGWCVFLGPFSRKPSPRGREALPLPTAGQGRGRKPLPASCLPLQLSAPSRQPHLASQNISHHEDPKCFCKPRWGQS